MKFNEWINDKNYEILRKRNNMLCYTFDINQEDVFSKVIEICVVNDPNVDDEGKFVGGYFTKAVRFEAINTTRRRNTSKIVSNAEIEALNISFEEYNEENYSKISEKYLKHLRILEGDAILHGIFKDKYINMQQNEKIKKTFKLTQVELDTKLTKIKKVLKTGKLNNYRGVLQMDGNKIVKAFPSISSVKIDGFDEGRVCELCQNKGNKKGKHKGFQWRYVENK